MKGRGGEEKSEEESTIERVEGRTRRRLERWSMEKQNKEKKEANKKMRNVFLLRPS